MVRSLLIIIVGLAFVLVLTALRIVIERRPQRPVGAVIFNFFVVGWLLYCLADFAWLVWVHGSPMLETSILHALIFTLPIAASWYVLHKRKYL